MVRLGDGDDKLIFRRDKGYLPVWYTEGSPEEDFSVEITRSNCENTVNPYSRVSIIETNLARAIVHWRYARDCSNIGTTGTGWVDEYFTVYPDGVCMRTVKNAAGTTFAQWEAGTPDIYGLQLLPGSIGTLPASWLDPPALSITSGDYSDEGFNDQRRCYTLQCNVTGNPTVLNATLDTSGGKSIHNPVIVIKNWGDADAEVTVDGNEPASYYVGYADDMYGDHLVVWLGIETTSSIDISIAPSGGSGQFVDRALPPDFGYDFENDVPPLPMGSPEPGAFGAYYTQLKFNNKFDGLWRVGEHADIVVQFDDNTHRFVFWRGTNYGPHWVSDTSETLYSNWYGTQFVERRASEWGGDGCCAEPMQDWDCRYAHARIISSNAARAIVQWRYASCDKNYDIVRDGGGDVWGDWDEEYFTIYPDAISVRKVTAYSSRTGGSDMESPHIEYHEAIPVTNPGTIPEDNIHWNALSATNYAGNKRDWVAQDEDGGAMTNLGQIADKPIMVVRMKGSTVPVSIVEGTSVEHDPVDQHDCRPFNAYDDWPGWPDDDRSAGGWYWEEDPDTHCYRNFWTKYPSHCSILHLKWDDYEHVIDVRRTKLMLFGMFDAAEAANVNNLIPLARSWEYAPTLTIGGSGFSGGSYDKTERAYKITRDSQQATELEFTINASSNSPVYNPCFVIDNWGGEVQLAVDGQPVEPGPDFRQGIEHTADEVSSLVIWLKKESTSPVDICVLTSMLPPQPAFNPDPADGAKNAFPDVVLGWNAGAHTVWHDVYFGTDFGSVRDAAATFDPNNVYIGRQGVEDIDYDPTPTGLLEFNQAYYWRIDEVNDPYLWTGDVWSFTVCKGKAGKPSPADGAKDVPRDVELGWSPGLLAASHDVYFGTDFGAVNNAGTSSSEYKGSQPLEADTYDPCGLLDLGTTYYWRIDEVNNPSTWKGDVWHLEVEEYIVVDDIESYNDTNEVIDTWKVWPYPDANNGAYVYLDQVIIHGGEKSMKFYFDTWFGTYFTAIRTYPTAQNWTIAGVNHLSLWFHGCSSNSADDQMYVVVKDGSGHSATVVYDGDVNDIKNEEWQEWNILLQDFNDGDVELTDVREVVIGANSLMWYGTIYYDDIRLYVTRCIPENISVADLSGDCLVDIRDFVILANQWKQPPGSPSADIAEPLDGFVNWKDLDLLAESWLEVKLWPPE
jgi:hypothetical protein